MSEYPRETIEWVTFGEVTVDGVPVTDYEYAVTHAFDRPNDWNAVATVDSKQAFLLNAADLGTGTFAVWVKVTDAPEAPVIKAGTFKVT